MQLEELTTMTREVTAIFDALVGPWSIETMLTELTAEVGTLADSVMITEDHRPLRREEAIDLEDDIADVMFMLIRIADHYDIDVGNAYQRMIDETRCKLEKRRLSQTPLNS